MELAPNPHLVSWVAQRDRAASGETALVVGCGVGDDAELLAELGFAVTAFDVAPSAVAGARNRFPQSDVDYLVADVFNPPAGWRSGYDLVVESYTVQVYQDELRSAVIQNVADMVAQGGTLLVIAHAAAIVENAGPPWPLTLSDIEAFGPAGLRPVRLDEITDDRPPGRQWRAEFRKIDFDHPATAA
ncbi:class I SAM-dependent methyltransferase [Micromonospora sp. NPDC049662]|uniref:class I SAM-dependent methyltransferase n=1 Tax=Micromonospora sp. NPDC049662 TaxID=3155397 RepID=UPI003417082E